MKLFSLVFLHHVKVFRNIRIIQIHYLTVEIVFFSLKYLIVIIAIISFCNFVIMVRKADKFVSCP
jgi:hypothetical protein